MQKPLIVKNSITINAPASKVWDALTNPEQTKKYGNLCFRDGKWSDPFNRNPGRLCCRGGWPKKIVRNGQWGWLGSYLD